MSAFHGLHFLHPLWLLALPPLLLLVLWALLARAEGSVWSRLVDPQLLAALRLPDRGRAHSPWLLVGAIWALAVVALAGPAWRRDPSAAYRVPSSWVLLLDLSPSMAAADLVPDRITRARYAVADLLAASRDARVALVVFAGEPHVVTPLTTDVATVRTLLQPLAPGLMPEPGDELAPALEAAERLLRAGHAEQGQVVVLSDGFADSDRAVLVAQRLRTEGASVHVVGIGTASGAPEPDANGGFVRDAHGGILLSRLQEPSLQRVADAGGGRFVSLSSLDDLITQLQTARPYSFDMSTLAATQVTSWQNGGVFLLPPLLLLAALLARRGWV
ncbi:MAG TPA: VWA domain-containing protein [Steroidobacteraceae bacterium]|nr:VWA domain-containing protein [Steroidobacteraceae bacterium]